MKRTILSVMLAALTMGATAQSADSVRVKNDTTGTKKTVGEIAKTLPQFPGGQKALKQFFEKNVRYPEAAQDYDVEGQVIMTFFVTKTAHYQTFPPTTARLIVSIRPDSRRKRNPSRKS